MQCCVVTVSLLAGFSIGAKAEEIAGTTNSGQAKWRGWFEFGGMYGSGRTSAGGVSVFAPITQTSDSLLFLDINGNFFEQDTQEGNFALGYRKMTNSGFNLGAWVGTDIRSTSLDNTFWQFSGGLEALSHNYDVRANFYIPLSDMKAGDPAQTQVHLQGNSIFMTGGGEVPLGGVDAEAGFRVPLEKLNASFSDVELRAYGGGYYFDSSDAIQEVAGGKARLELRIPDVFETLPGSQLTAGYQFTYDDVRKERHQAGLKLRIPFGDITDAASDRSVHLASLTPQERRMLDGIERDIDIVTNGSGREDVVDDATDVALKRVAYASDAATLQASVDMGANTHIIVQDGGTPIDIIPQPPSSAPPTPAPSAVNLRAYQTMQGGGSTILLRGAKSGTVTGFTAPGARPTLTSPNNGFSSGVIALASHTHVAGMDIRGGEIGIYGPSAIQNVVIEQNDVQFSTFAAIAFPWDKNINVKVLNNALSNSGAGVDFSFENENITVAGNTITDVGFAGIHFWQENNNVQILDNTIERVAFRGIFASYGNSNFTISGNTVIESGRDAIWLSGWQNGRTDQTGRHIVSNNTISGFGVNGIGLFKNHDNVLVAANTIAGTKEYAGAGAGVFISHGGKNIDVTRNEIHNISGNAFSVGDRPNPHPNVRIPDPAPPNTNLLLANNTLSGIGGNAFNFVSVGHTLLAGITGNSLTDAAGGQVCGQDQPNSFTGSFSVTDPGGLQTFTNGCQ